MNSPFLRSVMARRLLLVNAILAVFYFVSLALLFQRGNGVLFGILLGGEVFHIWQLLTLIHAAWDTRLSHAFDPTIEAPVDIFITVAGEPKDVVQKTLQAAVAINYPRFHVYLLNDGRVANKPNWREIEKLATAYPADRVTCITRTTPGGAKAGNINHALGVTSAPFVAILDCDHIPAKDFLRSMMGYFIDTDVAFVQSPQYYRNHTKSYVANAAWQQQTLFFGPICRGKDRVNALFMCGTNMVLRRQALDDVGGMKQDSITEDLMTSLYMHARGWRSVYVPRILAKGLAPEDLGSYWQQQYRWARGSLEVLLKHNPLFMRGLTWPQRVQYLASVTYYLSGIVVLADAVLPLLYFYFGLIPVSSATMAIALIFVPYIYFTLYTLQRVSSFAFSFNAMAFSIASWPIFLLAFITTGLRLRSSFKITAKERRAGNYIALSLVHIIYIVAILVGIGWAARSDGISSALITNASWGLLYVVMFLPFVRASLSDRMAARIGARRVELPAEELLYD